MANRHDDEWRAADSAPYLLSGFRKWPDLFARNQWIRFAHGSRATLEAILNVINCVYLYFGMLEVAQQATFTLHALRMSRRAGPARPT